MTILVRSALLLGFATPAAGLRLEPASLLVHFDLPLQALHDPNLLVSCQAVIDLLEHAATLGRSPEFGMGWRGWSACPTHPWPTARPTGRPMAAR